MLPKTERISSWKILPVVRWIPIAGLTPMTPTRTIPFLASLVIAAFAASVGSTGYGQPASSAAPKEYKVLVRYRIRAGVNQRLQQFARMLEYFKSIGFKKDPGPETEPEDPDQVLMSGTISSANARKLLMDPHVRSLLLIPASYQLPTGDQDLVLVRLELSSTASLQVRQGLAAQLSRLLQGVGFQESIGYDNEGHTRILGSIPASKLRALLEDLRSQSGGWLAPGAAQSELPSPLRSQWPLVVAEVIPVPAGTAIRTEVPAAPPISEGQEYLLKISHGLRNTKQETPNRIELVLSTIPAPDDRTWQEQLLAASPGLTIEGRVGPLVTAKATAQQITALAKLPGVITVRLPRPAAYQVVSSFQPPPVGAPASAMSRFSRVMAASRGKGRLRIAVVDDDFSGFEQLVGKQLPTDTQMVDLTAACDPQIQGRAPAGEGDLGHGTQTASAIAKALPGAQLTLVRIDRDAPFQLYEVARYVNGDPVESISLDRRRDELLEESARLQVAHDQLLKERKEVLENFSQDKNALAQREAFEKKQTELSRREAEYHKREARFLKLSVDLNRLKGTDMVVCGLAWSDGYPTAGSSTMTHYFDDRPSRGATWLQATGKESREAWAGVFRDEDGNGVMEFAPFATVLPQGRWTPELNFLGWQAQNGTVSPDLPDKAKLRISVQWREPHDPKLSGRQDFYQSPLANLKLVVLRQRDPSGKTLRADVLEVVAQSSDLPLRLVSQPAFAIYEQTLEFTVPAAGRYALRVEGKQPVDIRPGSVPTLPVMERHWELHPRIFVSAIDGPSQSGGHPVLLDYATPSAQVGMPADARSVLKLKP
jgi:hypothetical protein